MHVTDWTWGLLRWQTDPDKGVTLLQSHEVVDSTDPTGVRTVRRDVYNRGREDLLAPGSAEEPELG